MKGLNERLGNLPKGSTKDALLFVVGLLHAQIEKEDKELHAIGVAWPSAHTDAYRFAKQCLKGINEKLEETNATQDGQVKKDD